MNYKNLKIAGAIIIAILAIKACKKDRTTILLNNAGGGSIKTNYSSFAAFRKTMKPATQYFTINATNGGFIRGDRGYTFRFKPNSLKDMSGNTVSGNVSISLIEVTNVQEMLGTGVFTQATNGILGSAGMFKLTITQGSSPLFIDPSKPVATEVMADPNAALGNIQIFSGSGSADNFSSDSTANDSTVKWTPRDSIQGGGGSINYDSIRKVYDSIAKVYLNKRCIKFDLYFSNWCNLDAYYNDPSGAQVRVAYPNVLADKDTRVFMYINKDYLKGFYELSYDGTSKEFTSTYFNLPVGWPLKIIIVTRTQADEVKYEVKDIINATSTVHTCNSLTNISDADLEAFFKSL